MGTTLLNARQVTDLLGVDTSTVYRMAADGRLPAVKVGKQWRFPEPAIERLTTINGAEPLAGNATIDPDAARAVIELVARPLGVMMVVTDLDGVPLTPIANPCDWLAGKLGAPFIVETCITDWRALAGDLDLTTRFKQGPLGFECARAFIRSGLRLVGMVLAGGVAPPTNPKQGLFSLEDQDREAVIESLPRVAALLSRVAVVNTRSNS